MTTGPLSPIRPVLVAALLLAPAGSAGAQILGYDCGQNALTAAAITISVRAGGSAIEAGPVLGRRSTLSVVPGQPTRFVGPSFSLTFAPDLASAEVRAGVDRVLCRKPRPVLAARSDLPVLRGAARPPFGMAVYPNLAPEDFKGKWSGGANFLVCPTCARFELTAKPNKGLEKIYELTLTDAEERRLTATLTFKPAYPATGHLTAEGTAEEPGAFAPFAAGKATVRAERRVGDPSLRIELEYKVRGGETARLSLLALPAAAAGGLGKAPTGFLGEAEPVPKDSVERKILPTEFLGLAKPAP